MVKCAAAQPEPVPQIPRPHDERAEQMQHPTHPLTVSQVVRVCACLFPPELLVYFVKLVYRMAATSISSSRRSAHRATSCEVNLSRSQLCSRPQHYSLCRRKVGASHPSRRRGAASSSQSRKARSVDARLRDSMVCVWATWVPHCGH